MVSNQSHLQCKKRRHGTTGWAGSVPLVVMVVQSQSWCLCWYSGSYVGGGYSDIIEVAIVLTLIFCTLIRKSSLRVKKSRSMSCVNIEMCVETWNMVLHSSMVKSAFLQLFICPLLHLFTAKLHSKWELSQF